jgi:hypothetical protein
MLPFVVDDTLQVAIEVNLRLATGRGSFVISALVL